MGRSIVRPLMFHRVGHGFVSLRSASSSFLRQLARDISLWDDIKEVGCKINDGKGWSSFGNDGFFVRRNISNSSQDQRRQQSAMDVDAQVTGAMAARISIELGLNTFLQLLITRRHISDRSADQRRW